MTKYGLAKVMSLCLLSYLTLSDTISRVCHVCPKPLSTTIEQCMNTVAQMEGEVAAKLDRPPGSLNICREDMLGKPNTVLAYQLMITFSEIRCFAMAASYFFTSEDIQRINDIELGLTEINMSPEVCVHDDFTGDCQLVDTSNKTMLYSTLRREWVLLDALLINIRDDQDE